MNIVARTGAWVVSFAGAICALAAEPTADWPQYRGPNRDGVVLNSPKLLDAWPTNGPALTWKSEFILSYACGGVGNPVVADGRVFLYSNRKQPLDGGQKYKFLNTAYLLDIGWNPDLSEELAKKIEDARTAANRPTTNHTAPNWGAVDKITDADLDAYLAKHTDLDKYIKDFVATLKPEDAKKFGAYIRKRFCQRNVGAYEAAYSWDKLAKMSKLRDVEFDSDFEFRNKLGQILGTDDNLQCVRIYRATTLHDTVYCMDAKTGKTVWKKDFPVDPEIEKAVQHLGDWGTGAGYLGAFGVSSTPTISNGKCYVAGANGLYCLSVMDGSLVWLARSNVNGLPSHASPLVVGNIAYQQGSAYNTEDGKLLWSQTTDGWGFNWESPPVWSAGGRNYVLSYCGCSQKRGWVNQFGFLDLETGKILFQLDGVRPEAGSIYNPTISGDNLLIFSGSPNGIRKYKLSPTGAELLWTRGGARTNQVCGNWVPWQNHLYVFASNDRYSPTHIECLDPQTGELKWKSATYTDCGVSITTPVIADGKMFNTICPGNDHATRSAWRIEDSSYGYHLEMVRASPEGGYVRLGKFSPGICNFSSPAIADGRLYLRLDKCVACYDLRAN